MARYARSQDGRVLKGVREEMDGGSSMKQDDIFALFMFLVGISIGILLLLLVLDSIEDVLRDILTVLETP